MSELKSFFIGPKSENGELVEKLIVDILRDQFYWRKNYHPEDRQYISEFDKTRENYINYETKLRQELNNILSELKSGTPFFSPRYIGHMVSETTIPSIIGYFAAMLYNPNNVSSEASPVTTEYELKVGKMLCSMAGYDIKTSWGHLTSGGTVANLEAMWVARNILYLPVALYNAASELSATGGSWQVLREFRVENRFFMEMSGWELLNLNPRLTLTLSGEVLSFLINKEKERQGLTFLPRQKKEEIQEKWEAAVRNHSLQSLGIQNFFFSNQELLKGIRPPVVMVPQTKHYSYTKIFDLLGIGSDKNTLIEIGCDENFRVDTAEMEQKILALASEKIPVLAVISVFGSTEEGSVDSHHKISRLRERLEEQNGISFYLHSDAAWGGYLSSMLYDTGVAAVTEDIEIFRELENFSEYYQLLIPDKSKRKIEHLYKNIRALREYDSITLDPHKLGYIPYAAGGILFRSNLMKNLLSVNAPYVFYDDSSDLKFIGKYILEGSKAGAAACSCYLSHKVIPLNTSGYGKIISGTIATASILFNRFRDYNQDNENNFEIIPISEPDTNIVCFVINFKNNTDLNIMNRITDKVYQRFRFHNNADYKNQDYIISKTEFKYREYHGKATDQLLERCGISKKSFAAENGEGRADKINILRITCMNPLLSTVNGQKQINDFFEKLTSFIGQSFLKLMVLSEAPLESNFFEVINSIEKEFTVKIAVTQGGFEKLTESGSYNAAVFVTGENPPALLKPALQMHGRKPFIIISPEAERLKEELEVYGFDGDSDRVINTGKLEDTIISLLNHKLP